MIFFQMFFRKNNIRDKTFPFKKRMLLFEDFSPKQKRLALNIIGRNFFEFLIFKSPNI
jgi:hypothetical protein